MLIRYTAVATAGSGDLVASWGMGESDDDRRLYQSTAEKILRHKAPESEHDRKSYSVQGTCTAHFLKKDRFTFFTIVSADAGASASATSSKEAFQYLESVCKEFSRQYPDAEVLAPALCAEFSRTIEDMARRWGNEKIKMINQDLDDIRDTMHDNIDKILERGQKIDDTVEKTDRLANEAHRFRGAARQVNQAEKCKNVKLALLIVFVLLIVFTALAMFICGWNFHHCPKVG